MIQTKNFLIFALIFPILCLLAVTGQKIYILNSGEEVILPISGYDPRDLLSGHYLTYRIEYGVPEICSTEMKKTFGYVCLEPRMFSYSRPQECKKLISGVCDYNRFEAGIEKYYVPEDKAKFLEEKIRSQSTSIVLSISKGGQALVKDVLVNGKSWKNQ